MAYKCVTHIRFWFKPKTCTRTRLRLLMKRKNMRCSCPIQGKIVNHHTTHSTESQCFFRWILQVYRAACGKTVRHRHTNSMRVSSKCTELSMYVIAYQASERAMPIVPHFSSLKFFCTLRVKVVQANSNTATMKVPPWFHFDIFEKHRSKFPTFFDSHFGLFGVQHTLCVL